MSRISSAVIQILTLQQFVSIVLSFANPRNDFLLMIDESSVAVGDKHICVLEQKLGDQDIGGRAHCWGYDGHGKTEPPTNIDFVQLVANEWFTCGVTLEQTVFCWGMQNGYIPGLYNQISAGSESLFACGVMIDGSINCWGNSKTVGLIPRNIVPAVKYVQISCSSFHCCALDANAYPHCWGYNNHGELEIPTITQIEFQESVRTHGQNLFIKASLEDAEDEEELTPGRASDDRVVSKIQFRQLSVGDGYSCGIMLIGSHLRCWGRDRDIFGLLPYFESGPFRQVSVGGLGVCVIAAEPEEAVRHFLEEDVPGRKLSGRGAASKTHHTPKDFNDPRNFKVIHGRRHLLDTVIDRTPDHLTCWGKIKTMNEEQNQIFDSWDSIKVGGTGICGVSMDSELHCSGRNIPPGFEDHHKKFIVA